MTRAKYEKSARVPVFALYGDTTAAPGPGFLHIERIAERAPLYRWAIEPHRHAHLAQAILVTHGEGRIVVDEVRQEIRAPWLLWLPVAAVHGLSFSGAADGYVLTTADTVLAEALQGAPDGIGLLETAESVFSGPMPGADEVGLGLDVLLAAAEQEVRCGMAGSASAAGALLRLVVVGLMRARGATVPGAEDARTASLFRRFRMLVEVRFREHWPVSRYAAVLAVSTDRLHEACVAAVGRSPRDVLHNRLMVEARRDLIYTTLPVSQVALGLGFEDPAYFSRFFAKRAAISAAAFRHRHAGPAGRRS